MSEYHESLVWHTGWAWFRHWRRGGESPYLSYEERNSTKGVKVMLIENNIKERKKHQRWIMGEMK